MKRPGFALLLWLAATVAVATEQSPLDLVKSTTDQILTALRSDRDRLQKEPGRIYDLIERLVVPHFDIERMSRLALGKNWRQATLEQQRQFAQEFGTLLVRTYGTSLLQYTDQEVRYRPFRAEPTATDVTVESEIVESGGPPVRVQYSLELAQGEWKVYDVVIEGVSLVVNYRGSFTDQIRKSGMDGLIQQLAEKNKKAGG